MPTEEPASDAELSVVVLTRNEERMVEDALRSLLDQEGVRLEVVVVDSASTDGTLAVARRVADASAGRVRIVASGEDVPIGLARNMGIAESRAPIVAFMSADATAAPGWAFAMREALAFADVVYGRQEHAPPRPSVAATIRGLRYHHFHARAPRLPPAAYASNVNAGIRRELFDRLSYVTGGPESALDDILFTREAQRAGYRVAYEPSMLVRHKDVSDLAGEMRKNRREGYGWGILSPMLGWHRSALLWGAMLVGAAMLFAALRSPATAAFLALVVWGPAARRVLRTRGAMLRRPHLALAAFLASPAFDLVFLLSYLRGLKDRRPTIQKGRATGA